MHSDESYATKADIANIRSDIIRLEGKIETLAVQVKLLTVAGLYIGLALLFVDKLSG